MRVYALTPDEIVRAVDAVSADEYGGNVYAANVRGHARYTTFVLRCRSSRGPGARRARSGRLTVACTWEAHREVMADLFMQGARRISTTLADYRSEADFIAKHEATRDALDYAWSSPPPAYLTKPW